MSGSNALHDKAMAHVRDSLGSTVVYLDARADDIVARCQRMKVDRIVGQASNPLRTVIANRLATYERQFDVRVFVDADERADVVATRIEHALARASADYVSTRGSTGHSFERTVTSGLADDGGLYWPACGLPTLAPFEWARLVGLSFEQVLQR